MGVIIIEMSNNFHVPLVKERGLVYFYQFGFFRFIFFLRNVFSARLQKRRKHWAEITRNPSIHIYIYNGIVVMVYVKPSHKFE